MSKLIQLHRRIRKLENHFVTPDDSGLGIIAWFPDHGDGKPGFALFNTETPWKRTPVEREKMKKTKTRKTRKTTKARKKKTYKKKTCYIRRETT